MVILSVQSLYRESAWSYKQTRNRLLLHSPSGGVGVGVGAGVGVSGVLEDMLLVVLLPVDSAGSRE